jgi:hypothetical protein
MLPALGHRSGADATGDEIEAESVLTGEEAWAEISRRVTIVRGRCTRRTGPSAGSIPAASTLLQRELFFGGNRKRMRFSAGPLATLVGVTEARRDLVGADAGHGSKADRRRTTRAGAELERLHEEMFEKFASAAEGPIVNPGAGAAAVSCSATRPSELSFERRGPRSASGRLASTWRATSTTSCRTVPRSNGGLPRSASSGTAGSRCSRRRHRLSSSIRTVTSRSSFPDQGADDNTRRATQGRLDRLGRQYGGVLSPDRARMMPRCAAG